MVYTILTYLYVYHLKHKKLFMDVARNEQIIERRDVRFTKENDIRIFFRI